MKLDQVEYSAPSTKLGVAVTKKQGGENKPEITFEDFFYEFKEYIEVNLTDQVLHDEWYNLYIKEPNRFFKDVAALKAMEANKRILFLIKQSVLLSTSTKDVEDYFIEFPDDAKKIKSCLEEDMFYGTLCVVRIKVEDLLESTYHHPWTYNTTFSQEKDLETSS